MEPFVRCVVFCFMGVVFFGFFFFNPQLHFWETVLAYCTFCFDVIHYDVSWLLPDTLQVFLVKLNSFTRLLKTISESPSFQKCSLWLLFVLLLKILLSNLI